MKTEHEALHWMVKDVQGHLECAVHEARQLGLVGETSELLSALARIEGVISAIINEDLTI
jgi:hypothetical protein